MQFKQIIAFCLASTALASPIQGVVDAVGATQDLATIQAAFQAVEGALNTLDTSIKGITGAANVADIVGKSKAVEQALKDGTTKVSGSGPISLTEALQVQTASTKLTSLTTQVINDLIAKKDVITQAGQAKTTVDNLQAQKTASDAFVKAITSKVPSAVQSIAATAAKSVGDSLTKGITAFGGSAKRMLFRK